MDEDLAAIEAIRKGDESAFVSLIQRYREPVFRLALRYVGSTSDARDLTAEIFAKVFFNAGSYTPVSSVKSWIFTIAANRCRDHLRREKHYRSMRSLSAGNPREVDQHPELDVADERPDAADAAERQERLRQLQRAVQSLPEKLRFPFIFCVLENHSQDEAAEILQTSRKTVESRIYRARIELKSMLENSSLW